MRTLLIVIFALCFQESTFADVEIIAFDHALQNFNSGGSRELEQTFLFPDVETEFSQVLLYYKISCPVSPGDCDPWDRLGRLSLIRGEGEERENLEIARIVTPYDITGNFGGQYGTGPDSCSFVFDLTDYLPLLRDSVTLHSYIDTWVGGNQGWLITTTFEFIDGELEEEPFEIIRLWESGYVPYGDPTRPWEDFIDAVNVLIPEGVSSAKFKAITTGHGQGNSDNAAEFSRKQHNVMLGENSTTHSLWRSDCDDNPCSGQGGTWWYARAGWCPGSGSDFWELPVEVTPGEDLYVEYWPQPYTNWCRPNNDDCEPTANCPDCEYNYNGHGEPYYVTQGQLVLYQNDGTAVKQIEEPLDFSLAQNMPNPFNPNTRIDFELKNGGFARLSVFNLSARKTEMLINQRLIAGKHSAVFNASDYASGVYFYRLEVGGQSITRKMLLLK
jgi:hypothetical protein